MSTLTGNLEIKLTKCVCRDIDEQKRMYFSIDATFGDWKVHLWKRHSCIRRLHEELKICKPFFKRFRLPDFPVLLRYNGGYTSIYIQVLYIYIYIYIDKLNIKEAKKRMKAIGAYLGKLTTNEIALSTKYFPEFLKMPLHITRAWINTNEGFVKYQKKIKMLPKKKYAMQNEGYDWLRGSIEVIDPKGLTTKCPATPPLPKKIVSDTTLAKGEKSGAKSKSPTRVFKETTTRVTYMEGEQQSPNNIGVLNKRTGKRIHENGVEVIDEKMWQKKSLDLEEEFKQPIEENSQDQVDIKGLLSVFTKTTAVKENTEDINIGEAQDVQDPKDPEYPSDRSSPSDLEDIPGGINNEEEDLSEEDDIDADIDDEDDDAEDKIGFGDNIPVVQLKQPLGGDAGHNEVLLKAKNTRYFQ